MKAGFNAETAEFSYRHLPFVLRLSWGRRRAGPAIQRDSSALQWVTVRPHTGWICLAQKQTGAEISAGLSRVTELAWEWGWAWASVASARSRCRSRDRSRSLR